MSNKSKALARKAVVKAQKRLNRFHKMLPQLSVLAELDDEVTNAFLEDNMVCKALERFNSSIKEFEKKAHEMGVHPNPIVDHLTASVFSDRPLVTIMAKECGKQ